MDTNATIPTSVVGTSTAPPIATPFAAPLPPSFTDLATTTPIPVLPTYAKPFPNISKIEVFSSQNFKCWQEHIYFTLDMHGVAWLLSTKNTLLNFEAWTYANKVCRHTILTTLSNELFDVYRAYKEPKVIWELMLRKYVAKDVGKQKFVVGNYYKWEMVDNKHIKLQINEYYKLLEELKVEKIELPEQFVQDC